MKNIYFHFAGRFVAAGLFFFMTLTSGCGRHTEFNNHRVKSRPRSRVGRYASTTVGGATFVNPEYMGSHEYGGRGTERTGIVYTCSAGHIDIAHVRKAADWTAYLTANVGEQLKRGESEFEFKFKEPSVYSVQLTYPESWEELSAGEKDAIIHDISIGLGQYFAYVGCTWHEILTWFGYRSVGIYPEFPSAFSWEDCFSDLLGIHIGVKALRDTEHTYNEAMTLALRRELEELGVQSRQTAMRASQKVRGRWFSGNFLFLVNIKARNFDIGLDDGFITPWLVPSMSECPGAEARPYPVPNLDFLADHGFSMSFEVQPRVFESSKILKAVYPEKKDRKKCLEPSVHFAVLMDHIKKDAVTKYGYDIDLNHKTLQGYAELPSEQLPVTGAGGAISPPIAGIADDPHYDNTFDFQDVFTHIDSWLAESVVDANDAK